MISVISAVADEAAHCYMRKLFERCHGLAILNFGGWVGVFSAVVDEAIHFSPLWQVVTWHSPCLAYGMGGFLRGCGRSHPLLSALFVCEVPLDILYLRGDRGDRGGLSAVISGRCRPPR